MVSTATLASGSLLRNESRIESEILSHILSGCPSVTLSDVNIYFRGCIIIINQEFGNCTNY